MLQAVKTKTAFLWGLPKKGRFLSPVRLRPAAGLRCTLATRRAVLLRQYWQHEKEGRAHPFLPHDSKHPLPRGKPQQGVFYLFDEVARCYSAACCPGVRGGQNRR